MFRRILTSQKELLKTINFVRFASEYSGPKEKCMNVVQILGRVGQDPITRGEKGNFVTFSVATSRNYPKKHPDGKTEYVTKTEWHHICVFKPFLIERAQNFISKGSRLLITGSIEYLDHEKPDGNKMNMTRIVPDDIFILTGNDSN